MNNFNSVLIEGTLIKDAINGVSVNGQAVCGFSIESKHEMETGYFDIQAFGKLAEHVRSYARKGRGVRVVGRLKQENRTSFDGKTISRLFIVAEHIEYRPDSFKADEAEQEET